MIQLKNILFPTDFSRCANQALDHAVFIAKKYHANIHKLHAIVLHDHFPFLSNLDYQKDDLLIQYDDNVKKRIAKLAKGKMKVDWETRRNIGINITMEQQHGNSPSEVILDYAKEKDIDLIVMGTHGRRGMGHLVLGSEAESVVRLSSCPVLTIREHEKPIDMKKIDKILVPIDFSEHSKQVLSHAKEIAYVYGAKLQLLHVFELKAHPFYIEMSHVPTFDYIPEIENKCKEQLECLYNEAPGPDVEVEYLTVQGHPVSEIIKYVKGENPDLIVIATHGLTGIKYFLLGSVAEKVVQLAPCPVLTIKPFGKSLI